MKKYKKACKYDNVKPSYFPKKKLYWRSFVSSISVQPVFIHNFIETGGETRQNGIICIVIDFNLMTESENERWGKCQIKIILKKTQVPPVLEKCQLIPSPL